MVCHIPVYTGLRFFVVKSFLSKSIHFKLEVGNSKRGSKLENGIKSMEEFTHYDKIGMGENP
jgi:hypothetical protein